MEPTPDLGPTAVVTDLQIVAITADKITIRWTVPACKEEDIDYQIRHFEDSLSVANWFGGTVCSCVPPLADSGVTQLYDVTGLPARKLSYIAIRILNTRGYFGPVSKNVPGTLPSLLKTPVSYSFAGKGTEIYLGDFDGDGFLDVARAESSALALHLNDGQGGYAGAASYPVGKDICQLSLEVADFDGNGHPDIAVLQGTGGLKIFLSAL